MHNYIIHLYKRFGNRTTPTCRECTITRRLFSLYNGRHTPPRIKRLFSHVSKLQSNCRRKQSALSIAGWFIVGGGRVAILSLYLSFSLSLSLSLQIYIHTFRHRGDCRAHVYLYVCGVYIIYYNFLKTGSSLTHART